MLGKTFTRDALAALAGLGETELEPLLVGLVRKEVLGVQADPRSPERGQYGFLQDLVRRVAYETLSKKRAQAPGTSPPPRHLERSFADEEDEIAEVVASHYLAAYEAAPDADDAAEIKSRAREPARPRRRARSVARRGWRGAALLRAGRGARGRCRRASRAPRAGERRWLGQCRRSEAAETPARASAGAPHAGQGEHARSSPQSPDGSGISRCFTGRGEQGIARMEEAFEAVSADEPDADVADPGGSAWKDTYFLHR